VLRLGSVERNDIGVVVGCAPDQSFGSRLRNCLLRLAQSRQSDASPEQACEAAPHGTLRGRPDRHEGDQIKRRWEQPRWRLERTVAKSRLGAI